MHDARILQDDTIPISSIEFDYKPNAPRIQSRHSDVGNLYENMAKQMAAFLEIQESRHPKMVDVLLTNETHVNVVAGGDDDNILDLSHVPMVNDVTNNLPVNDIESHGNTQFEGNKPTNTNFEGSKPKNPVQSTSLVDSPNKTLLESGWAPLMVIDSLPGDRDNNKSKLVKVPDTEHLRNTVQTFWKPANSMKGTRD